MRNLLLIVVLCGLSTLAHGAACNLVTGSGIACVQQITGNLGSGTSGTLTFGSANTSGHTIVCVLKTQGTNQSSGVPTQTGNTYAGIDVNQGGANQEYLSVYYAYNVAASSAVVHFSWGGGTGRAQCYEFSGLLTTDPLDVHNVKVSSGNTVSGNTVSTTQATELAFGVIATDSAQTFTIAGSWTLETATDSLLAAETQILTSTDATFTSQWGTLASSPHWTNEVATFKASGISAVVRHRSQVY